MNELLRYAQGVKSRLSALAAAAELEADALRSRIRDKQDRSQLRLESHLQAIREKATTGPRQPVSVVYRAVKL
uniref:SFRICE_029292 n=1 Tax=Spodoptera frugiperda TaxID=7108 RepID=A0A2H1WKP9_SPOFR